MSASTDFQPKKRFYTRLMDRYRGDPFYSPVFNKLIRTGLRLKIAADKVSLKIAGPNAKQVEDWYENHQVFFGFAMPRSGTFFLANFLNHLLPDAQVEHEANVNDYWFYGSALQNETNALAYISNFKKADLARMALAQNKSVYGEINPFLRRHCRALQQLIPSARFFHLVRDGREVLRSIMSREILDATDPLQHRTFPPEGDPYREKWKDMSRFEKICWMWQADNRYIRQNTKHTVQFEKLKVDFGYFKSELLDFLGLEMTEPTWQNYISQKKNITPKYKFPHWQDWCEEQTTRFWEICGAEMKACGY